MIGMTGEKEGPRLKIILSFFNIKGDLKFKYFKGHGPLGM